MIFSCYPGNNWCFLVMTMQAEHDGSDVQVNLNVEHIQGEDIFPNMTRNPRVKYITYYEDSESIPGRRTAVWELDKGIRANQEFCESISISFCENLKDNPYCTLLLYCPMFMFCSGKLVNDSGITP